MRKIDSKGLELCDAQGKLFQRSVNEFEGSSANFIKVFMNSEPAKLIDRLGFFDSAYILSTISINNPTVNTCGSEKYEEKQMYWIGYLYRYWSYTYKWTSKKVFKSISGKELYQLYEPYHSLDPAIAINRIIEAKEIKKEDDYLTVLKRIYNL